MTELKAKLGLRSILEYINERKMRLGATWAENPEDFDSQFSHRLVQGPLPQLSYTVDHRTSGTNWYTQQTSLSPLAAQL